MKKIFLFAALLACISCTSPVLEQNEYVVIDTLHVSRNGFNTVLGYDVIVMYDSAYHYGNLNRKGELTQMNIRKIELEQLK